MMKLDFTCLPRQWQFISFFWTKLVPVNDDEHRALRKVLARNVCSSAE